MGDTATGPRQSPVEPGTCGDYDGDRGFSHLHLDQVISENNLNYGIRVKGHAKVSISNSQVNASGFRKNTTGVGKLNPGIGVDFEDRSRWSIVHSSITGSARAGINVESRAWRPLELEDVQLFDNNPNFTQRRSRR
ncbi:MAG: hypothetical protein H0U48_05600 [Euzebyaceae bacterium]|jgi:hypothetical protein|nr:hypothetical protein [Euzebyaceae bacterium]